jgi:hypothetical protein
MAHFNDRASSSKIIALQPEPRKIAGWRLDPRYGRRSTSERALLAVDMAAGIPLEPLSGVAARAATGTSQRSFSIAKSLSSPERAMVEAGTFTLTGILQARRKWATEIAKTA